MSVWQAVARDRGRRRGPGQPAYTNSLPVWRDLLSKRGLYTTTADVLGHANDANGAGCVIIVACRPSG